MWRYRVQTDNQELIGTAVLTRARLHAPGFIIRVTLVDHRPATYNMWVTILPNTAYDAARAQVDAFIESDGTIVPKEEGTSL